MSASCAMPPRWSCAYRNKVRFDASDTDYTRFMTARHASSHRAISEVVITSFTAPSEYPPELLSVSRCRASTSPAAGVVEAIYHCHHTAIMKRERRGSWAPFNARLITPTAPRRFLSIYALSLTCSGRRSLRFNAAFYTTLTRTRDSAY